MDEQGFLRDVLSNPEGAVETWLVLADWLEEHGDPRAELTRLLHNSNFQPELSPEARDARVRELLASGMRPLIPEVANSIGMRLTFIPAGTFQMGSPGTEEGHRKDEGPQHEVEITRPFLLGVYPVTQGEYQKVMGDNPSYFSSRGLGKERVRGLETEMFPVEQVSWEDAAEFCRRLSALPGEKEHRRRYRLPSEAEWEYSCRGGAHSSSPFYFGGSLSSLQANFNGDSPYGGAGKGPYLARTWTVGWYPANAFGLYDMHGNVWEWCGDWHAEDYYQRSPRQDPQGPQKGTLRVLRGGAWNDSARYCRSASRDKSTPDICGIYIGFRVARVIPRAESRS
jgi:uncharacterized protein (TIGR02996 family)